MDLEKLKELAQKATPGPWFVYGSGVAFGVYMVANVWEQDARYIAAANPRTVLELIAEVERLRAEAEAWKVALEMVLDAQFMSESARDTTRRARPQKRR